MNRKEKSTAKQKQYTRQLINTKAVTDHGLLTYRGDELVYFIIKPTNISVLSETNVSARIYSLMTVLKGMAELEFLCLSVFYSENQQRNAAIFLDFIAV